MQLFVLYSMLICNLTEQVEFIYIGHGLLSGSVFGEGHEIYHFPSAESLRAGSGA